MAGRYQAYPEYKDTGDNNLGNIPSHWHITKVKFISRCLDGSRIPLNAEQRGSMQGSIPYWGANSIVDYVDNYLFDEELVLLGEDGAPFFEPTKDVAFNVSGKIWPNNHVHVLRPDLKKISSKFLKYALNCVEYRLYITGSTRDKLNQSDMNEIFVRSCTVDEQEQIVNFLDHETAKIDTLIDKQQQLIKLLKEKRQAVISHAVTKGLNPAVQMKDSGVEWLGEVPEHWVVKRLGRLFSESCAKANSEEELQYPLLTVSIHHGISDKELDESELDRKVSRSDDRSLYKIVRDNDLAYNMMRAWQGGFGASKLNGLISPAYVVCKPKTKINSSYYELVLRSPNTVTELKRFSRGITDFRLRLYWDEFKSVRVPVPPVEEIDQILEHVNRVNSKYDQIADVAQRQIDLLQERRTALISAAVTGKIDVRNWQPAG